MLIPVGSQGRRAGDGEGNAPPFVFHQIIRPRSGPVIAASIDHATPHPPPHTLLNPPPTPPPPSLTPRHPHTLLNPPGHPLSNMTPP